VIVQISTEFICVVLEMFGNIKDVMIGQQLTKSVFNPCRVTKDILAMSPSEISGGNKSGFKC
jgi:hypothetical protein